MINIYWLVVWNILRFPIYIGKNHPKWLIFSRGVERLKASTSNSQLCWMTESFFLLKTRQDSPSQWWIYLMNWGIRFPITIHVAKTTVFNVAIFLVIFFAWLLNFWWWCYHGSLHASHPPGSIAGWRSMLPTGLIWKTWPSWSERSCKPIPPTMPKRPSNNTPNSTLLLRHVGWFIFWLSGCIVPWMLMNIHYNHL